MVSRSPPRHKSYPDRDSREYPRRTETRNGYRRGPSDNKRDDGYERRRQDEDDEDDRARDGRRSTNGKRRRDDSRRDHSQRDREPQRQRVLEPARNRDRGRDDDRDRAGPSRRSASPRDRPSRPRSSRPHSAAASRSPTPIDKAKPNFAPSGLLAAATNTVRGADGKNTVLKYNEPPEARKPVLGWRLYVFKGAEQVELLHIHRQSAYLIGRDRTVADISVDHPSCSKQHAVIQYRHVQEKDEFGSSKGVVKPFIIDLESTNGTHVNDEAIPVSRYYELKPSDVIKFGQSTREYVLLHDEAQ